VADALVRADLHLAADVRLHLAAQVSLDLEIVLDPVAQGDELLVAQVLDAGVRVDPGSREGLARAGPTDSEDVGQCDLDALLAREVHSNKTCHLRMVPYLWFRRSGADTDPAHPGPVLGLRAEGDVPRPPATTR
jgi:hypothetical protein